MQSTSVGTSVPSATVTSSQSLEPPIKRQRRAVTLKKAVVAAETESDEDEQDTSEITIAKVSFMMECLHMCIILFVTIFQTQVSLWKWNQEVFIQFFHSCVSAGLLI